MTRTTIDLGCHPAKFLEDLRELSSEAMGSSVPELVIFGKLLEVYLNKMYGQMMSGMAVSE